MKSLSQPWILLSILMMSLSFGVRKIPVQPSMFARKGKNYSILSNVKGALNIVALDFDGVLCATATESSGSAITAAKTLWPHALSNDSCNFEKLSKMLIQVRPYIETGYENVLLCRYFSDKLSLSATPISYITNYTLEQIVDNVTTVYDESFRVNLLQTYNIDKDTLVKAYGTARDNAINSSFTQWVSSNIIYPHVANYFSKLHRIGQSINLQQLFIITKKQERFVHAILQSNAIPLIQHGKSNSNSIATQKNTDSVCEVQSNIFDLENTIGSKVNVLKHLLEKHCNANNTGNIMYPTIHFVEDRYETLRHIMELQDQPGNEIHDVM